MKEIKVDLRIVKTKKAIYMAFMELLEANTFEEIKVSEICSKALINRSTFYTHFDDKYTLLNSLINDMKDSLKKLLKENSNITNSKEYYMEIIKILLDHVEEKKHFYTAIMANNRNSIAMDMLYDVLEEDIMDRLKKNNKTDVPSDFVSYFYLGAIINIGLKWSRNQVHYTKEDIISYLEKLIPEDI